MSQYTSTFDEACNGIFLLTMRRSSEATEEILKQSDKLNLPSRDEIKLKFDLSIPFFSISEFVVRNSQYIDASMKRRLFDGAVHVYFDDLADYSKTHGRNIQVDTFITNDEDRKYYLSRIDGLSDAQYFPSTSLIDLAGILVDKRFPKCQKHWQRDWEWKEKPNFASISALNAFQYVTGKERWNFEALMFSPILWFMFLNHYSILYDAFHLIKIWE